MSLIKIIANGLELDIVTETLKIVKENNSFIIDFTVSYSNYPFLIVENSKTIKALGSREINSVNKPKSTSVIVEELGESYYGEIQVLSYIPGFRKVTLKYSTELITLMNKKIADLMPVVSIIPGELNPVPFSEESDINYDEAALWATYPISFLGQKFPSVKYQFPTMYWKNKFGIDLTSDDDWYLYHDHINEYNDTPELITNNLTYTDHFIIENKNVVAPQIFLLSPLFFALSSIGFKADGDFYNDSFISSLLFYSSNNNLSKSKFLRLHLPELTYYPDVGGFYESEISFLIVKSGTYTINYSFDEVSFPSDPDHGVVFKVFFLTIQGYYEYNTTQPSQNFSGTITVDVGPDQIGMYIYISYFTHYNFLPNYSLSISNDGLNYFQMHPTIQLGRYLPDWTFGTYLNELKKLFNLNIKIDDFTKKVILNFNENTFDTADKVQIKKSLSISEYDQQTFDAFHLKYQNDVDTSLWINRIGNQTFTNQTSDFLELIESKFKLIPNNSTTANLSDDVDSKDGVGLMIYDPTNQFYISTSYLGQSILMDGPGGIYYTFWKRWLRFRLNSDHIEMTGYFTEIELSKIQKIERIYIDYQEYLVSSIEYSETKNFNFEVLLKLESVCF